MSSFSLLSQQAASSARLVFQAAETEGKGLRAHRLQLLGERCLGNSCNIWREVGVVGALKSCLGVVPSGRVFMKQKEETELVLKASLLS